MVIDSIVVGFTVYEISAHHR